MRCRKKRSIEDLHFDWGERFIQTAPYNRNKVARYYLARTLTGSGDFALSAPELGRPEHHESRWLSAEEAAELLPASGADSQMGD